MLFLSETFITTRMTNIVFPGEITAQKFCAGGMWLLEESRLPSSPQPEICTNQLQTGRIKPEGGHGPFTIKASDGHCGAAGMDSVRSFLFFNKLL